MKIFGILIIFGGIYLIYQKACLKKPGENKLQIRKNTPYKGTIHGKGGVSLSYEVSAPEKSASEDKADELLKEATQKKNNDDWDGAINCLREAYKQIAQSKISYPIETYLRLPLYLQQAGHYTESAAEFERLLRNLPAKIAKEFSHISKQEQNGLIGMEASIIYDKMRLASQREKQFTNSVYYQIISNANRAIGLKLQEREKEIDRFVTPEFWAKNIEGLLKKAKSETLAEVLVDKCIIFSQTCTSSGLKTLDADIKNLLKIP